MKNPERYINYENFQKNYAQMKPKLLWKQKTIKTC